jgi:hypothetical protein
VSGARLVMNVLAFQAAWLGSVGGAAVGRLWVGPVAALVVVAWHVAAAARRRRELVGVLAVAALGTAWDAVPAALGLIEYRGGVAALGGAPYWIVALWLVFATTLNVSLRWLRERLLVAAVLGAVVGPLCYQAAAALGALTFADRTQALGVQAVGWAVLLPLTVALATRCDGVRAAAPTDGSNV